MQQRAASASMLTALMLGMLLTGCATQRGERAPANEKKATCNLIKTPKYAVKGKTPYDQEWVDDTTERLVGGCKQPRPQKRPASLDAPRKATPK